MIDKFFNTKNCCSEQIKSHLLLVFLLHPNFNLKIFYAQKLGSNWMFLMWGLFIIEEEIGKLGDSPSNFFFWLQPTFSFFGLTSNQTFSSQLFHWLILSLLGWFFFVGSGSMYLLESLLLNYLFYGCMTGCLNMNSSC